MKRMILAKCMGALMALTVMAGFAGQASAGLREYCDSYARDVAHRKTNGGADVLVGTIGGAGPLGNLPPLTSLAAPIGVAAAAPEPASVALLLPMVLAAASVVGLHRGIRRAV